MYNQYRCPSSKQSEFFRDNDWLVQKATIVEGSEYDAEPTEVRQRQMPGLVQYSVFFFTPCHSMYTTRLLRVHATTELIPHKIYNARTTGKWTGIHIEVHSLRSSSVILQEPELWLLRCTNHLLRCCFGQNSAALRRWCRIPRRCICAFIGGPTKERQRPRLLQFVVLAGTTSFFYWLSTSTSMKWCGH